MSIADSADPTSHDHPAAAIELVVRARPRDLGGFSVRRVLPSMQRRLVGPFIFFDHLGPAEMAPGTGIDVRPHPHIALATVTYLFEGTMFHRDSLGSAVDIAPGDVNWMIAGRGIAHSERTSPEARARGQRMHGIQAWVALPKVKEEAEPAFFHHDATELPRIDSNGAKLCVIAGSAFGRTSPVEVASPTLYVAAILERGASIEVPLEHEQRAAYVAEGEVTIAGDRFGEGELVVFAPNARVAIEAESRARIMLLGGAPIDGERHIWWNFVSSSQERIERAKADWREGRFAKIPGDDVEFIPLPEA